jgi:hypothetical protein
MINRHKGNNEKLYRVSVSLGLVYLGFNIDFLFVVRE